MRFTKKKIWSGLSKLSIGMMLFVVLMISNPVYWPQQIARHLDTSKIVTPNDPLVQQLNVTMWPYLQTTFSINESVFYSLDNNTRLELMTNYSLYRIEYHLIPEVYGVIDYTATPHEALTHGKGDCQSQAVVMVSFFIFMGYNAYCCESPYHWYTCVYFGPGKTDPHYYNRQNWTDPEIMLNDKEVFYTMNPLQRLGDILFGKPFYDKIVELFSIPIVLYILPFGLVGIGFLMTLAIESTNWKSRNNYLKNAALSALILIAGFFGAYGLGFLFYPITLILMLITVGLAAQFVHSNIGARILSKPAKSG
jgi:hypothetical protein